MRIKSISNLLSLVLGAGVLGCATPQPEGPADLSLPMPESTKELGYLGLAPTHPRFHLEDIQCEFLIVDCFDMYCHSCHTSAKHVNTLYELVMQVGLDQRVKFVGLGVGNSPLETEMFHKKFEVPFPSFPDRSNDVARQFGRVRLPSLLVLRKSVNGWELMHQTTGTFRDPEELFMRILEDAGEEQALPPDTQEAAGPICLPGEECPPLEKTDVAN